MKNEINPAPLSRISRLRNETKNKVRDKNEKWCGIKIKFISIIGLIVLLMPLLALAETAPSMKDLLNEAAGPGGAEFKTDDPKLGQTGIATVVGNVVRVFLSFLGVIFISYMIYGGYTWLTAAGNDEKITKAKNTIRDGIIGLIIVLAAYAIYTFIIFGLNVRG